MRLLIIIQFSVNVYFLGGALDDECSKGLEKDGNRAYIHIV